MTYNQQRHIQLLKRLQDFTNQGKSFYQKSPEESLELSSYNVAVEENIFWEQRYKVEKLMQEVLNRKIDGQEFCDRVFGLRRNLMITCDQSIIQLGEGEVTDFQPDPRAKKVSGFLDGLFCYCDDFMEDYENDQFFNGMQNGFLNFQKALKDSMDFSELVDQLSWETKDQYFELIEEFLDESSNFLNFKKKYESLVKVAKELESNSIFLKPSYQALGFSNYILILIQLFDRYQMDPKIRPKVFKSWVRKILLEMKNHYS